MENFEEKKEVMSKDVIGAVNFIRFGEDNKHRFLMDFGVYVGIPTNVNFYPFKDDIKGFITFIGDGYGIQNVHSEKYGIKGKYGNGSISVFPEDIPHLIDWCKLNLLKEC